MKPNLQVVDPADADQRATLRERRNHFRARLKEIDAEARQIEADLWGRAGAGRNESAVDAAALALLDGEEPAPIAPLRQRLEDLGREREVVDRARRLADERLALAERKAANAKAAALRPRHRAAVRRIASALLELSTALDAEAAVRDEAGPRATALPSGGFPGVGDPDHDGSPLHRWLKLQLHHGSLTESEVWQLRLGAQRQAAE